MTKTVTAPYVLQYLDLVADRWITCESGTFEQLSARADIARTAPDNSLVWRVVPAKKEHALLMHELEHATIRFIRIFSKEGFNTDRSRWVTRRMLRLTRECRANGLHC